MDFLEYPGMSCEVRGGMSTGMLKLTDEKIQFTHNKTGKKEAVVADDIDVVNWQRLAGGWGIRIFTKDGNLHRFAGFKEAERERVANHFTKNYNQDMLDRELSVKGWNWGATSFNGNVLGFEVGKNDAFEIPLNYVSHCTSAKSEVTLEFANNDDAPVNLSEIRFHIPTSENAGDVEPAETFKEYIVKKAKIGTASTGDAIAIFQEINCLAPRGRYAIKMYPNFIHLHGKTFDYKIPVGTVMRLFLLPHKDQRQMYFCVNLDPPIKQGQTRYHYIVCSFMQDEETDIELPFTEEELQEKYEGKLQKEMSGPTYEVVSKLMKAVVNKKVTIPGSFVGHSGTPAISCSYKAASGMLYPLERGFIFVYKPPIFIKFEDVKIVNFARSGGSTRSFDIEVVTRGDTTYTFSSIEKDEETRLRDFLKNTKKLNVHGNYNKKSSNLDLSGDNVDHFAERVKNEAGSSESDASMSSDDEDFNPDHLTAKDVKEEYDSDPSDTGSDTDDGAGSGSGSEGEKQKRREEKAKRKAEKAKRKKSSAPSEKSSKAKKKSKLPGQPKKPLSAYFLWLNEEGREEIKKESPNLAITEVAKVAGEKWRNIDEDTKKKYEEKNKELKEKYDEEYKEWFESGGKEAMKAAKKEGKEGKKSSKSPKKKVAKEITGGSGGAYKSSEFIEDDSDSSDADKADGGDGSD